MTGIYPFLIVILYISASLCVCGGCRGAHTHEHTCMHTLRLCYYFIFLMKWIIYVYELTLSLVMLFCLSKSTVRLFMAIYNWFFSFSFLSLTQLNTKMTFLHPLGLSWVLVFFDTKYVALLDHRLPSLFRPWILNLELSLFPIFSLKSQNLTLKIK